MASKGKQYYKNEWMRRLRKGDERVFAEFVNDFESSVFLCCYSLGLSESEAEDAASETFLAAYRGIKKYNGRSSLGTWIWRIAYCKAVDCLRQKRRWSNISSGLEETLVDDKNCSVIEKLEKNERVEIVWEKVNQLPKLWSVAIILFYREEKSIAEIANIMNVRESTVKTYLFRGKKRFGMILEKILKGDLDEIR